MAINNTDDNLSAVLHGVDDLRMEQRPVPGLKDNQVLIRVHSVGICGSDVHYLKEMRIGHFVVKAPMVLGHESSGTIVEVGNGVTTLRPGDRVAMEPGVPCRRCEHCRTGRYNLCHDLTFFATPPDHGVLSRYCVHEADFCFKLPDNVSFEEGAMLEPLSVGVHACRRAGVTAGHNILVCGAGPIGLVTMLTAKAMGASEICITDIDEGRLSFAKSLGANHTVHVRSKDASVTTDHILSSTGWRPDISIECSGAEASIQAAITATKSGGTFTLIGHGAPDVTLPLVSAAVREVDIRGVFRYANCYPIALGLVASGKVDLKPLITHRYKLEESKKAFATASTPAEKSIKVMIKCQK